MMRAQLFHPTAQAFEPATVSVEAQAKALSLALHAAAAVAAFGTMVKGQGDKPFTAAAADVFLRLAGNCLQLYPNSTEAMDSVLLLAEQCGLSMFDLPSDEVAQ